MEAERTKLREKLDKVDKNLSLKNEKGPKKTISPQKLKIGDGVKVLKMCIRDSHWPHTRCPVAVFLQELHIPDVYKRQGWVHTSALSRAT